MVWARCWSSQETWLGGSPPRTKEHCFTKKKHRALGQFVTGFRVASSWGFRSLAFILPWEKLFRAIEGHQQQQAVPPHLLPLASEGTREGLDNCLLRNFREGRDMSLSPSFEQFPGLSRPSLAPQKAPRPGARSKICEGFQRSIAFLGSTVDSPNFVGLLGEKGFLKKSGKNR